MTEETAHSVPQWKRELISRRRSSGRAASVGPLQLTCPGVVIALRHPHETSGMRVPSAPFDIHHLLTQIEADQNSKMVEEKSVKVRSVPENTNSVMDKEPLSDSSEEFKYGPGIVSKLKSKFLSLTLRENNGKVRPSLSNMRRATSLENLLDESTETTDHAIQPKYIRNPAAVESTVQSRRSISRNSKDYMKRARSVEAVVRYNRCENRSIDIQKSVIDWSKSEIKEVPEKTRNRISFEEKELPPPDTVKSTLRIFEPGKQSPPATKVPTVAAKPAISPKPKAFDKSRETKSCLQAGAVGNEAKPESKFRSRNSDSNLISPTHLSKKDFKIPIDIEIIERSSVILNKTVPYSRPPLPKRDETDDCPVKDESIMKVLPDRLARQLPRPEAKVPVSNFESSNFDDSKKDSGEIAIFPASKPRIPSVFERKHADVLPPSRSERQEEILHRISPTQAKPNPTSAGSPLSQMKQVGVIRPIITLKSPPAPKFAKNSDEREVEKNFINNQKCIEQPVTKVIVSLKKSAEECVVVKSKAVDGSPVSGSTWGPKPHSMVFNFSNRKNVPDYIENDGLIMTSKERPKAGDAGTIILRGSTADSSTDFEPEEMTEPPSPCQIIIIGGNVLINGKSSLQKAPKQTKLRIKFNDEATTFEYPSESSMLEDSMLDSPKAASPISAPSIKSGGFLASYTPSQLAGSGDFQLGITKTQPVTSATPKPVQLPDEEYLRPAEDANTVVWSADTADDLLF